MDIGAVITGEVLPWFEHTATIGVMAGGTVAILNWIKAALDRQPMIEHEFFYTKVAGSEVIEGRLRIEVFNRATAPITLSQVAVIRGSALIRDNGRYPSGNAVYWGGSLDPYASGAHDLPRIASMFFLTFPDGPKGCVVQIVTVAQNQWLMKRRLRIKIPAMAKRTTVTSE